jgi:hypothetical protein
MGISLKDILSLENMLTPKFIQIIYKIGLVGVLFAGLKQIFSGGIITGIVSMVLGFLVIRVVSEMVIVYFKSNDIEVSMEDIDYDALKQKYNDAKVATEDKFKKVKGSAVKQS